MRISRLAFAGAGLIATTAAMAQRGNRVETERAPSCTAIGNKDLSQAGAKTTAEIVGNLPSAPGAAAPAKPACPSATPEGATPQPAPAPAAPLPQAAATPAAAKASEPPKAEPPKSAPSGLDDRITAAEQKLDADIKACKPIKPEDYAPLLDAASSNYRMGRSAVKAGMWVESQKLTSDRNRAFSLLKRAKETAANQATICPPKEQPKVKDKIAADEHSSAPAPQPNSSDQRIVDAGHGAARGDCYSWIDAVTGSAVPTTRIPGPLGVDEYRNYINGPDRNHAHQSGQSFVREADGNWIDAATGAAVPTTTIPATLGVDEYRNYVNGLDRVHAHQSGQDFVRLPCPPPQTASAGASISPAAALTGFDRSILDIHNSERAAVGVPPLKWNEALAHHATDYAQEMAKNGELIHAPRDGRGIERENLQKGLIGWSPDRMMQDWLSEKRLFHPGLFPNVCDGDWSKCGHYTQMIWPTTTDVGCGEAQGLGFDWFVCRYSPGGNQDGKPVGMPSVLAANNTGATVEKSKPPCRWVDARTGEAVRSGPMLATNTGYADESGARPGIEGGKREGIPPDPLDPNSAHDPVSGRNFYFDATTCTWRDARTGEAVRSGPMLATNTGYADESGTRPGIEGGKREGIPPDPLDPNSAHDPVSGRNFVKVPLPPE